MCSSDLVILGLLTGPALGMDAGVDHQPAGTPHLVSQPPEVLVGSFVDFHFHTQLFSIKRPALTKGGNIVIAAKCRLLALL